MWKLAWDLVAGGAKAFMADKVSERETKREIKKIKAAHAVENATKDKDAEISWDNRMAKASETSWKDEWWTVILTAPLVMLFWPVDDNMSPHQIAAEGFERLNAAPDFYTAAVGLAIAAAFGYRQFVKPFMNRKK